MSASSSAPAPAFADLGLPAFLLETLTRVGYEMPTPIQQATIPPLLAGRDLIGMAQTGTGKTAAFALPILARIDTASSATQALVLCPTRELAIQVAEAFQTYARGIPDFHVLPIYGGQDMGRQIRGLRRGAQVIVATPGRLLDHIRRRSVDLGAIDTVVLDEADEMLRMGFIDDVDTILGATPAERQVMLFSATMPEAIRRVADRHLRDPESVRIQSATGTNDDIKQFYWLVEGTNKLDALTRILEVEDFDGMIVFVRTKNATVELADKLSARGFSAAPINGDMNQSLRQRTVQQLKSGALDILVATDVAARGLDVERISHVMNYDIPYDSEAYVHRIGRTGRAGRSGKAILFVAPRERRLLRSIEKATRRKVEPMKLPSRDELAERRSSAFRERIGQAVAEGELGFFHGLVEELCREQECSVEDAAAAMARLLQQDKPLQPAVPGAGHRAEHAAPARNRSASRTTGDKRGSRRNSEPTDRAEPRRGKGKGKPVGKAGAGRSDRAAKPARDRDKPKDRHRNRAAGKDKGKRRVPSTAR